MSVAFFIAMFDVTQIKLPQDRTEEDYVRRTYPEPAYAITWNSDDNRWAVYDTYAGEQVAPSNVFPNDFDLNSWREDSFNGDLNDHGLFWVTRAVAAGLTDSNLQRSAAARARGITNVTQWLHYVFGSGTLITDPRNSYVYYVPDNGNINGVNSFDLGLQDDDPFGNVILAAIGAAIGYAAYAAYTGTALTDLGAESISTGNMTTAPPGTSVDNVYTFDDGSTIDFSTGTATDATDTGVFSEPYIDEASNTVYNPDGSVYDMSTGEQISPPTAANPLENVPQNDVQDVTQAAQTGTSIQAPVQSVPTPPIKATPSLLQQLGINPSQLITTATGALIRYVTTGNVNGVPQYRATPVRLPNGQYAYVGANGQVIGGAAPSGFGSLSSLFNSASMPIFIGASLLLTLALSGKKG